ncbi:hypothetical protein [Mesorhizobium mediterraneum]|uniref:hypothetical protein n=1 Tax=Mesorhizobium mediterraneum TaxID=43617 RepID=UPI001AEE281D|nr:hypothetical protein [Mesorhizobium mediterraneum]
MKDIVFIRMPAGDCMDWQFRVSCTGRYTHGDATYEVSLSSGGQLILTTAGQPAYVLEPHQGRIFAISGLDGFRVEFRSGRTGAVDALILHQPNGSFEAPRVP